MSPKALPSDQERIIDAESDDISELSDDQENDLSSIFAAFGTDIDDVSYMMKVYRIIPDTADMPWLFNCVPSELPIDNKLRDKYGGGRFEVRVYRKVQGRFKLFKKPVMLIEAPLNSENDAAPTSDLATLLREVREQNREMFNQLSGVIKQGAGVPNMTTDPFSMMRDLMGIMRDMMPQTAPGGGGNIKDMVETLAALKELVPESKSGETNWMDLAGKLLESPNLVGLLEGAVQGAKARLPTPGTAAPTQGQVAPGIQAAPPKTAEQEQAEMLNLIINQFMSEVIEMARTSEDPGFAAEAVMRKAKRYHIPPEQVQAFLLQPDSLDKLAANAPDVNKYRPWFEMVQAEIKDMIEKNELP